MSFNNLGDGAPFYVLRKGDKPTLDVGIIKSRTEPHAPYKPQAAPMAFTGINMPQVVDIVVTFNGIDENFSEVPSSIEIAERNGKVFTGSRDAMLQAVDAMIQASKKALEQVDYHRGVLKEGEKMLEILNPRYADEKKQARAIKALEEKQTATDAKLDSILSILHKLDAPAKS